MLLFMLFGFLSFSHAKCEIPREKIPKDIQLIETTDIPKIVRLAPGCITVVEIWAGWCQSCAIIAPKLHTFAEENLDIRFIQISADTSTNLMKKFLKKYPPISPRRRLKSWNMASLEESIKNSGGNFKGSIPYFMVFDQSGTLILDFTEPKDLNALEKIIKTTR